MMEQVVALIAVLCVHLILFVILLWSMLCPRPSDDDHESYTVTQKAILFLIIAVYIYFMCVQFGEIDRIVHKLESIAQIETLEGVKK